jgi:hypothetical protein
MVLWQAPAVQAQPKQTATFTVKMRNGAVDRIMIHVTATGDDYLIDGFVDDDSAIIKESSAFSGAYGYPGCTVSGGDRRCRTTCAFAENARPFTHVRRRAANGRFATLWPLGTERSLGRALKFYAGASSASSDSGDCISPDGRFISLFGYPAPYETERDQIPGIYALSANLPAMPFRGASSGKTYGEDRYFLFAGWQAGKSHTLRFNWGGDDGTGKPTEDEALP